MAKQWKNKVYIVDVTNRDGVRVSKMVLSKLQKTMINMYLNDFGACESEIGFPGMENERNYINANVQLAEKGVLKPIILRGWVRAMIEEVKQAIARTDLKHYHISAPFSDASIQLRLGKEWNFSRVLEATLECVKYAKSKGIETVTVGANDAPRLPEDKLLEFGREMKKNNVDRIRYCDTWGFDDPYTTYSRIQTLAKAGLPIELHMHNDLGLAVANSLEGVEACLDSGVDCYVTTTINGFGERAGNADLLSVVVNLQKSRAFKDTFVLDKNIVLSKIRKIAFYTASAFGHEIPPNQVGVGSNVFIESSHLHVDGMMKEVQNLGPFTLEDVGHSKPEVIETGRWISSGGSQGIKGFRNIFGKFQIKFKDDKECGHVLDLVRYACEHNHAALTVDELRFIYNYPDLAEKILSVSLRDS